jgi:hypothetical protein
VIASAKSRDAAGSTNGTSETPDAAARDVECVIDAGVDAVIEKEGDADCFLLVRPYRAM